MTFAGESQERIWDRWTSPRPSPRSLPSHSASGPLNGASAAHTVPTPVQQVPQPSAQRLPLNLEAAGLFGGSQKIYTPLEDPLHRQGSPRAQQRCTPAARSALPQKSPQADSKYDSWLSAYFKKDLEVKASAAGQSRACAAPLAAPSDSSCRTADDLKQIQDELQSLNADIRVAHREYSACMRESVKAAELICHGKSEIDFVRTQCEELAILFKKEQQETKAATEKRLKEMRLETAAAVTAAQLQASVLIEMDGQLVCMGAASKNDAAHFLNALELFPHLHLRCTADGTRIWICSTNNGVQKRPIFSAASKSCKLPSSRRVLSRAGSSRRL